jgi:hypothetical protein
MNRFLLKVFQFLIRRILARLPNALLYHDAHLGTSDAYQWTCLHFLIVASSIFLSFLPFIILIGIKRIIFHACLQFNHFTLYWFIFTSQHFDFLHEILLFLHLMSILIALILISLISVSIIVIACESEIVTDLGSILGVFRFNGMNQMKTCFIRFPLI